tara:strand:- start:7915 stop:8286 length:372 start_codon:yes stop_codon:yes gene_type:complete
MNYEIYWEQEGVFLKFRNAITVYDIINADLLLRGDKRYDRITYIIYDLLDIDSSNLSLEAPKMLANMDNVAYSWNNNIFNLFLTKDSYIINIINEYLEQVENPKWQNIILDSVEKARMRINNL